MKRAAWITICVCLTVLAGCAGGDHNPREGGLFGGVAGLGGGSYKKRVAEREARLEQLRVTQHELDVEKARLESQKSSAQLQVDQDRAKVKAMQTEVADLEKKAKALSARQGADQKRVEELQQRIDTLKSQVGKQRSSLDDLEGSGLGDADTDLRRKQLDAQRDALHKEYDLLMKMQMELAR